MLSCKDVVKIISTEDRPTWRRRLSVRFHLLICHHCSRYARHLEILKTGFNSLFRSRLKSVDPKKIKEIEDRVVAKLK